MDPNANLIELRRLVDRSTDADWSHDDQERLVELFEALDRWLTSGGFLPTPWAQRRKED